MAATHEVFNQPTPLADTNLFSANRALQDALRFNAPGLATDALTDLGALAGSAVQNSVGGGSVRDIYRVSVQMRDGSVRAFDYQQPPQLNIGEYVRVDGNQIYRQ